MKSPFLLTALLLGSAGAQSPAPPDLPIGQKLSISQFGAKGDGVSDDSAAFAAGIAAASKVGAQLTLGNGTYRLKQTIHIARPAKPIAIVGGAHSILLFAPDQSLEDGFLIDDVTGLELQSFTIEGSSVGLHYGINVNGSTNIRLQNLVIENINGPGASTLAAIRLAADDQIWITNSTMTKIGLGAGKPADIVWSYFKTHNQHLYIAHNHIFDNTANIVLGLFDVDHAVVQDNVIDQGNNCVDPCINNGYGILFYKTAASGPNMPAPSSLVDESVINNQVTNTAGSAIYLQGVDGAKVAGNQVTATGLRMDPVSLPVAGIALNVCTKMQLLSNTINGSKQAGIALATTSDILIQGNQIRDSAKCGIHLRVAQQRTTIQNNTVDGTPVGVLSERGPVSTIVKSNVLTRVTKPTVGEIH